MNETTRKEYNLSKKTLIGKKFESIVNGKTYYAHSVAIDTETKEFRVVYSDGISIDEYDTTLTNFIKRFKLVN